MPGRPEAKRAKVTAFQAVKISGFIVIRKLSVYRMARYCLCPFNKKRIMNGTQDVFKLHRAL